MHTDSSRSALRAGIVPRASSPPSRAHDSVRALYRQRVAETRELLARITERLAAHEARHMVRPWDLAALGQLGTVTVDLRRALGFLDGLDPRNARLAEGGAR